jgi:uncharacterized protein YggE
MIRSLVAALGLLALAGSSLTMPANAQDTDQGTDTKIPPRLIWLSGHGEVRAAPDMAVVTVGVQTTAKTAREAASANNTAMTQVIATLKSAEIAEKDIQTSNFTVNPRYENDDDGPAKLVGYDVSNNVAVIVRDLAKLGSVLDNVVSEGSNQIGGIAFDIADRSPVEDEARKGAVADAKRKAEIYAAAAGIKLGRIMSITEGAPAGPVPVFRNAMKVGAAAVPVAQGEQTVAIDVNIAWEIN